MKQNELESERTRVTEQGIDVFNDHWLALHVFMFNTETKHTEGNGEEGNGYTDKNLISTLFK
ncbi:MAG: hypothetical protein LBB90_06610 [Tannerella sp.]|jgi:hypothetical protein|nr:hypothetical protein [Tannerella sp.]